MTLRKMTSQGQEMETATIAIVKMMEDHQVVGPAVEDIRAEAKADVEYQALHEKVKRWFTGPPKDMPLVLQFKSAVRHDLTLEDGLVLLGSRLVIPEKKGREMPERLHKPHQGMTRTKQRARQAVYWSGLDKVNPGRG